ncbi:MAG: sulfurtransferase TusA family protein [Gammaproteobacteria bacterium]|jgi:tRNA 2-thiouridine synthesizing protein A|nr:sulfurtransferase TusA family protein [Gammaproteobacteria bacterium]
MSEHTVDAKRLLCPMPVIRTQNKAEELAAGDILTVICTDPGATNDIPAWCRINGHKVLDILTVDNEITITIEVGGLG